MDRRGKELFREAELHDFAKVHECRPIGHPRRLLHIVGDNDDRQVLLQGKEQLFNFGGGDGIQRRAGFVHQQDIRFDRERAGDTEPLLLPSGETEGTDVEPIFHFIPQPCAFEPLFYNLIQLATVLNSMETRPIGHVFVDRFRKGVRFLKDHPDTFSQVGDIHIGAVDIHTVEQHGRLPIERLQSSR